jgi:hypothetical protein
MSSRFTNPKANRARLVPAYLALAGLAALISAVDQAGAAGRHGAREVESVATRTTGEPIMAIVSLHSQLVTVYDAKGWILRAPVSRRPPESSASSRNRRNTIRTCMMMPTCPTCSASPGPASHSMAALCQDIQRPMAVFGCPSTLPRNCSMRPSWDCG